MNRLGLGFIALSFVGLPELTCQFGHVAVRLEDQCGLKRRTGTATVEIAVPLVDGVLVEMIAVGVIRLVQVGGSRGQRRPQSAHALEVAGPLEGMPGRVDVGFLPARGMPVGLEVVHHAQKAAVWLLIAGEQIQVIERARFQRKVVGGMDVVVAEDVVPSVAVFRVMHDAGGLHKSGEEIVCDEIRERLHLLVAQFKPHLRLPLHPGRPSVEIRGQRRSAVITDLRELLVASDQNAGVGVERFLDHATANRFRNLGASVEEGCDLRTHRLFVEAGRIEKGRQLSFALALGFEREPAGRRIRHGRCVSAAIPAGQQAEVRVIGDPQFQGGRLFRAIDPEVIRVELIPSQRLWRKHAGGA